MRWWVWITRRVVMKNERHDIHACLKCRKIVPPYKDLSFFSVTLTPFTCLLFSGISKNGKLLADWKLGYSWDSWAIVINLLGSIHISSNSGVFLFIAKYPPLKWGTSLGRFLKTASTKSFFSELLIRSALFALHITAIKVFGSNALDAAGFCGISEGVENK